MTTKTAIITGASSGLGERLALDLAAQDMNLVLSSRRIEPLQDLATRVERAGSRALVQTTDVTDAEQCRRLIQSTVERFDSIDYLILNAGVSMWVRFDEVTDPEILKKIMDVNYLGAVYCMHAALPYLKKSKGAIVLISSAQSTIGVPKHTGYAASKHALRGFLESLELELQGAVDIVEVLPGWISGTGLRSNAYQGDGSRLGDARPQHNRDAVSVEECSRRIVQAIQLRRRKTGIPWKMAQLHWFKIVAPWYIRRKLTRSMEHQEKLSTE